jgi:hypothetical protein
MQPHDHDRDDPGSSFFLVYARRALGENGGGLRTHRRRAADGGEAPAGGGGSRRHRDGPAALLLFRSVFPGGVFLAALPGKATTAASTGSCWRFWAEKKGALDAGEPWEGSGEEKEGRRVMVLAHPCSPPDGDHGRAAFSSVEQRPGRLRGILRVYSRRWKSGV